MASRTRKAAADTEPETQEPEAYVPQITSRERATVPEIAGYGTAAPGDVIVRTDDGDSIALPDKWAKALGVEPDPPKED